LPLLNRLDRYLLREITATFVAVTGVLLVVLMSNQFARVLGQAAQSDFPGGLVVTLIGLTTLQQLTVLVPIGLFLGIILALGRLYHESEMTAMTACGVGPLRVYKPIALVTLVVALLLALLSYRIVPAAWQKSTELRVAALRAAQFGALEAGRFRSLAGGDVVFYAERVGAHGELYDVFVQRSVGDRIEVAMAERAEQRGAGQAEQVFVLYNGRRYEGVPGAADWRIVEFREHGIPVRLPDTRTVRAKEELRSTAALMASQEPRDRAELAWRTAVPVMAVVLMVLAVPLARLRPRQGRFARVGLAVLVYFLYSNLLAAVRAWIQKDAPGGQLGLWWVHLIPLAIAAFLLWHELHPGSRFLPSAWPALWRRSRGRTS
jgi:lipopolysaccharide export system permease protein